MYNRSLKPFSFIICSSRNQGKSVLLRDLYERHWEGNFHLVLVFSNTLGTNWYDSFIPASTKYHQYDEDILINLFKLQQEHKEKTGKYLNVLAIFDDCISEELKHSEVLQNIFILGRHLGISICFITQSPTLVKSTWRQNTTHLAILRLKGLGKEHIINNFLLDLIEEEDTDGSKPATYASKLLRKTFEERYRALIVEYDNEGNSLRDVVSWYKANPKFKRRHHPKDNN